MFTSWWQVGILCFKYKQIISFFNYLVARESPWISITIKSSSYRTERGFSSRALNTSKKISANLRKAIVTTYRQYRLYVDLGPQQTTVPAHFIEKDIFKDLEMAERRILIAIDGSEHSERAFDCKFNFSPVPI